MRWLDGITDPVDKSLYKLGGDSDGKRKLLCCSPWGHKESDMTQRLNNNTDPGTVAKDAVTDQFYEDLHDLLELTPKKMSFLSQRIGMQKQEVKRYLE